MVVYLSAYPNQTNAMPLFSHDKGPLRRYAVRLHNEASRYDCPGLYVVRADSEYRAGTKAAEVAARMARAEARAQGVMPQFVREITWGDFSAVSVEVVVNG
jgi:hypothetical protein